ncbi:signal transduction histidine kinase [Candidatus Scalindua japonica]|uniref:Signal transduction histidine kinase n=1 Tax=Candidatus Scalindua japonica TaxID=1284222 RepID=A0A286U2V6_9BACT|nr:PilZ domain-containing protein [Candidatus Scalindua japonica]GAX62473.1 signal transduction histidine kinase [Candidatus Scalindua japonica]
MDSLKWNNTTWHTLHSYDIGDSMKVEEIGSDKRNDTRLDLSLEILLKNQNLGKTINISTSGVYFEVITNDIEAFTVGTTLPIKIAAITTTPGFEERKIKLDGSGVVVRSDIMEVTNRGNKLRIALKFNDTLNIIPNGI